VREKAKEPGQNSKSEHKGHVLHEKCRRKLDRTYNSYNSKNKKDIEDVTSKDSSYCKVWIFSKRATKEAANSGREDPIARMVNPTTRPEILNLSAKPTAPFTKI